MYLKTNNMEVVWSIYRNEKEQSLKSELERYYDKRKKESEDQNKKDFTKIVIDTTKSF
jgi:hypothetical protein